MNAEGIKILLIDDAAIILHRLQAILGELEQVTSEAVLSAEIALGMMEGYNPDVMVLDISMPGMNGIELLKKMGDTKSINPVIIMLSDNSSSTYREECMRLGAHYFLDKSRDFLMISSIIKKIQITRMLSA